MSEMIEQNNTNDVESASENHRESETDCSERKPRSRERGPDKKPCTYKAARMSNLT